MTDRQELEHVIREQFEAERGLEACKQRVKELVGLAPESDQRKKKASRPKDFARACGL